MAQIKNIQVHGRINISMKVKNKDQVYNGHQVNMYIMDNLKIIKKMDLVL